MKLYQIAHARTGDKGNTCDISVVAYRGEYFDALCAHLTVQRVGDHFGDCIGGDIVRYVIPGLLALKFVLHGALGGGVTRTLNMDRHGKSLGSSLLDLELDVGPSAFDTIRRNET